MISDSKTTTFTYSLSRATQTTSKRLQIIQPTDQPSHTAFYALKGRQITTGQQKPYFANYVYDNKNFYDFAHPLSHPYLVTLTVSVHDVQIAYRPSAKVVELHYEKKLLLKWPNLLENICKF